VPRRPPSSTKGTERGGYDLYYGLLDPTNQKIRYVGRSVRPLDRCYEHLQLYNLALAHPRRLWIEGLLDRGLKPELVILEELEGRINIDLPVYKDPARARIHAAEEGWIRRLLEAGHPLTNVRGTTPREDTPEQVLSRAKKRGRERVAALGVHRDELNAG
jgi:hypothetical protein